jgi:hypothetical protein
VIISVIVGRGVQHLFPTFKETHKMTSSELHAPGIALLAALAGNVTTTPPNTLPEIMRRIERLSVEADRLARGQLDKLTDDPVLSALLHRIGVILRDTHVAIATATAAMSPELKDQLGIKTPESAS